MSGSSITRRIVGASRDHLADVIHNAMARLRRLYRSEGRGGDHYHGEENRAGCVEGASLLILVGLGVGF
jgi:hypothetical protein